MEYKLDSIKVKNFWNYKNEVSLPLRTNRSFHNDKTVEKIIWKQSRKINNYKKIIGIWGKNSSGKTTLLRAISTWIKDFSFKYLISNKNMNLSDGVEKEENDILYYRFFNDPKKPIEITLSFSTDEFSFDYKVIEKIITLDGGNRSRELTENLKVYKNDVVILNWTSKNEEDRIFFLNNMLKKYAEEKGTNTSALSSDSQEFYDLVKVIQITTHSKIDTKQIFNLIDNSYNIEKIFNVLTTFYTNLLILNIHAESSDNAEKTFSSINEMLTLAYNDYGISKEEIKTVINGAVKTLDNDVKSIKIDFLRNKDYTVVRLLNIESFNGNRYLIEQLSAGTRFFLRIIVCLWFKEIANLKANKNITKYVFIDELGANWHTNLTHSFLKMISNDIFGPTVIVFTSHDSIIGNYLPTDSVYVIDNQKEIRPISSFYNEYDNAVRRNKKFSSMYLNDALDEYSTNPKISNMRWMAEIIDGHKK